MSKALGRGLVLGVVLLVGAARADAAFHFMKVVEVFPGTPAAPNAQYVVLQMYTGGQTQVQTHSVIVYDAAGNPVGTFTFAAAVSNGSSQDKILVATTEAATFFNVTANLTMTPVIQNAGGAVCFDGIDCVTWGNYAGTPPSAVSSPAPALPTARALIRNLKGDGILQASDDSNSSSADFLFGNPAPRNNAGVAGTLPAAVCRNNALEGLELCDDGNEINTDACLNSCVPARCGDSVTQDGVDECDDGNESNVDACLNSCILAVCGDGFVRAGFEACDDGDSDDGDECANNCLLPNCGDGITAAGEACDDMNVDNTDACLNSCVAASCGDGFAQTGVEACDDGDEIDDNDCPNSCLAPTCGDTIVQAGEACDDGNDADDDGCIACVVAACGDGVVQAGVETCDDGNTTSGDGCNVLCTIEGDGPPADKSGCSTAGFAGLLPLLLLLALGFAVRVRRSSAV